MPIKPKLGQNFLIDRNAMQRIVDSLGDLSQMTVIEIGPGQAALTTLLANRAGRLMAIELDRVLAAQLRLKFARYPNVEIIEADILKVDLATMLGNRPGPLRDLRPTERLKAHVVGNLPYYITSDILLRLFEHNQLFQRLVLMVQFEVAERIASEPGGKEYGVLSATAQMYADVELLFKLPPEAFNPPPKVHSAVLRLTINPKFESFGVDELGFIEFLRMVFAQKRKTLANNLKEKFATPAITAAMKTAKLKPDIRAEAVPLEAMAKLYNALKA
jgi:16S rRNA (adenine1518-N6/adenine1519-N6)-dimethyltransferase